MTVFRCKHWNYPEHMGLTVSVVLVFHNEGFTTLMRNVHQVVYPIANEFYPCIYKKIECICIFFRFLSARHQK